MSVSPTLPNRPTPPPPPPPAAPGQQVDQWLELSSQAADPHTALDYAQRAIDARPDDPRVLASIQRGVLGHLGQDAFVAYMAETDRHYVITFRNSHPVMVPKARALPEVYPSARPTPNQRLWKLVGLMLFGLIPAGLGALVLSPLVVPRAAALVAEGQADPREQRSAWLAMVVGAALGLVGAGLALILLLHIIG
jgi:hypothetical protein